MTWKQLESHDKTHWLLLRSFTQHRRGCRGGNKGRRFLPSTLNTMDRLRIVYSSQRLMFLRLERVERMVLIISKCGCVGAGSDLIRTPGVQHICRARLLPGCRVWSLPTPAPLRWWVIFSYSVIGFTRDQDLATNLEAMLIMVSA